MQHAEVVGAIADGDRVFGRNSELFCNVVQCIHLGLLAEDGFGDEAGEDAVLCEQNVGAVFIEAERRRRWGR